MANVLNVALAFQATGTNAAASAIGGLGHALSNIAQTAAGFALGQGLTDLPGLLSDAASAAADDEASTIRLNQAIKNLGGDIAAHTQQVNDAITAGQRLGFTDDDIRDSYIKLIAATGDSDKALQRQHAAMDLARGAGIDLGAATKLLGKLNADNIEVFKRMGIVIGDNATEADALAAVQAKFGDQANAYAQSTKGQMEATKIAFDEMKESLGYAILPLVTKFGAILADNLPTVQSFVDLLGQGLSAGADLVAQGLDAAYRAAKPFLDTLGAGAQVVQGFVEDLLGLENTDAAQLGLEKLLGIDSEAIGPALDTLHNISEAIKGVATDLGDIGSKLASGDLGGAISKAVDIGGGLVKGVTDWVGGPGPKQIADALVGLAESAWSWVSKAGETAIEKLGGIANFVDGWVKGGGLANIATALEGLAESAWSWVLKAKDTAIDGVGKLVDGVKAWIDAGGPARVAEQLWALAARAWDWVQQAANTAIENLTPIITSIKNWATETAGPAVLAAGKDLGQKLYDGVNEAWNAAVTAGNLQPGLDKLAAGLEKVGVPDNLRVSWALWGDTLKIVSGWLDHINTSMSGSNGTSTLMKIAEGAVSAFVVVLGGLTRIGESASLIVNDLARAFDSLGNWLGAHHFDLEMWLGSIFDPIKTLKVIDWSSIGSSIVDGLIGGLTAKLPDLEGTVRRIADSIPDWMRKLLGISSPSLVLYEIGQNIGQGLANGLAATQKPVTSAAEHVMGGLLGAVSHYGDKIHDEVNNIISDLARVGGPKLNASGKPSGDLFSTPGSGTSLPVDSHGNPYPNPAIAPWTGQAGPARPGFTGGPVVMGPNGPYIPSFATGGIVPGPIGAPVIAKVHGGEVITPPGESAGQVNHFYGDNYFTGPSMLDALNELSQMVA
jgi:hypothetical protein